MSETDEARVSRYEAGADPTPRDEAARATPGQAWHELLNMTEGVRLRRLGDLLMAAGSVMGLTISREFQADMAAGWKARAETAEAELADARERLRRCEERLAAVEALAENWDIQTPPVTVYLTELAKELHGILAGKPRD